MRRQFELENEKSYGQQERGRSVRPEISPPAASLPAEPIHQESHIVEPARQESPQRIVETEYNPRKRRQGQQCLTDSLLDLEFDDIFDYLPSQPLLLKLVDYFCVTFHHWIPCVHKKRLRVSVVKLSRDPQLCLVLHALVAATLRHLDQRVVFMDKDQIVHQTRISRFIVETFALKNVSLESLRALIIIVFDYVSVLFPFEH